jgi:hypothetical protein
MMWSAEREAPVHTTIQHHDDHTAAARAATGVPAPGTGPASAKRAARRRSRRRHDARHRHPSANRSPGPAGRTLALADIENLCGVDPRTLAPEQVARVLARFRVDAGLRTGDLVVVGANPRLALRVGPAADGCLLRFGAGPDGADRVLLGELEDPGWIDLRFDRVVIGSGDHIFTDAVATLNHLTRVRTVVVSRLAGLSQQLRRVAQEVRFLPAVA